MYKYIRNREGGALIMVILVMVIMTILGTTLLSISLAENKQAIIENNRIEAYYLARSGVESTAAWILGSETTQEEIDQIVNKISEDSSLGNGKFNVEVIKNPDNEDLVIIGTGYVNGISSTTRMIIEKSRETSDDLKFDYSVYLMNNTTYNGNITINGSLGHPEGVTVIFTGNAKLNGTKEEKNINYVIAKIPDTNKTMTITDPPEIVFADEINTIKFDNGINTKNDLNIYTGSGTGEVNVVVNGDFTYGKKIILI